MAKMQGFIGFEQFSPTIVTEENKMIEPIYSDGDPELVVISKKLAKRDPTTKLKGLTEMTAALKAKPPMVLRKFIPHWVHVYSRLSYDRDHRVREMLNSVHLELVKTFPKAFQKRLQCIVGVWWMSMCDPQEGVNKLPSESFNILVGETSTQALLEVETDLANHFRDVLSSTPASLVDTRLCSKEDSEDVFVRVSSSTILSIAKLFQRGYKPQSMSEMFDANFWICLESEFPYIRKAAYTLLNTLCSEKSFLQDTACVDQVSPKVFKCMSEKHPPNLAIYWECLVNFISGSELSWQHWNCDSTLVKSFGMGHVPYVFIPRIMVQLQPIHSHSKKGKSKVKYYGELFEALFRGNAAESDPVRSAVYIAAVAEASLLIIRDSSEEIAESAVRTFLRVLDSFFQPKGVQELDKFGEVLAQPLSQNIIDVNKFSSSPFKTLFTDIWVLFEKLLLETTSIITVERILNLCECVVTCLSDRVSHLFTLAVSQVKLRCEVEEGAENARVDCLLKFIVGVAPCLKAQSKCMLFEGEYMGEFNGTLLSALVHSDCLDDSFFPLAKLILSEALESSEQSAVGLWRHLIGHFLTNLTVLSRVLGEVTPSSFHHPGLDQLISSLLLCEDSNSQEEDILLKSCLRHQSEDFLLLSDDTLAHVLTELCARNEVTSKSLYSFSLLLGNLKYMKQSGVLQPLPMLKLLFACIGLELDDVSGEGLWRDNALLLREMCSATELDTFVTSQSQLLREHVSPQYTGIALTTDVWATRVTHLATLLQGRGKDVYVAVGLMDTALWTKQCENAENDTGGVIMWKYYEALLRQEATQTYLQANAETAGLIWSWLLISSREGFGWGGDFSDMFASRLVRLCPTMLIGEAPINSDILHRVFMLFGGKQGLEMLEDALVVGANVLVQDTGKSLSLLNVQVVSALIYFLQTESGCNAKTLNRLFQIVTVIESDLRTISQDAFEPKLLCFKVLIRFICSKFSEGEMASWLLPFIQSTSAYWNEKLDSSVSLKNLCDLSLGMTAVLRESDSSLMQQLSSDVSRYELVMKAMLNTDVSFHHLRWLSLHHPPGYNGGKVCLHDIITRSLSLSYSIEKVCSHMVAAQSLIQKYCFAHDATGAVAVVELLSQLLPSIVNSEEEESSYMYVLRQVCCDIVVELSQSCLTIMSDQGVQLTISSELFTALALLMKEHSSSSMKMCTYHVLSLCLGSLFKKSPVEQSGGAEEQEEVVVETETASFLTQELWSNVLSLSEEAKLELESGTPSLQHLLTWMLFAQFLKLSRVGDKQVFAVITQWVEDLPAFGLILSSCTRSYQEYSAEHRNRIAAKGIFNDFADFDKHMIKWDIPPQLAWLSGYTLFHLISILPSLSRKWWSGNCSKSLAPVFQNFVETEISRALAQHEMSTIEASPQSEAFSIHGSSVSREVSARYVQDECVLELVVRLPLCYPLRNVEVDCRKRLGVSESRWRRWVLQIVSLLSTQDGSVLDAVMLWKSNVDKEFEGLEPCPICYCILHPKSLAMPSLECHTCNNKFHPACLYKWFNSSHKSKCPLCQQPFNI